MDDPTRGLTFAELLPGNVAEHTLAHEAAEADRRYMLQRRDQFSEKLLIGTLALNGASIVALLGILGTPDTANALGFVPPVALWSAGSFAVGIVLAGYATHRREVVYIEEAGDAGVWEDAHAALAAFRDQAFSEDAHARYNIALRRIAKTPAVGYQWSEASNTAQAWAGGAWLAGVTAPLLTKLIAALPHYSTWWPF